MLNVPADTVLCAASKSKPKLTPERYQRAPLFHAPYFHALWVFSLAELPVQEAIGNLGAHALVEGGAVLLVQDGGAEPEL